MKNGKSIVYCSDEKISFLRGALKMQPPKNYSRKKTRLRNHPLVQYDPEVVNGGIQEVLKLGYFEAKAFTKKNCDDDMLV